MVWTREHQTQYKLALYYALLLQQINQQFEQGGEKMTTALKQFDTERPMIQHNMYRCFDLAALNHDVAELAVDFTLSSMTLFDLRLTPSEHTLLLQKAIKISRVARTPVKTGKLLTALSSIYNDTAEYAKAISHCQEALRIAETENNNQVKMLAHRGLATIYIQRNEADKAQEHLALVASLNVENMTPRDLSLIYTDRGNTEILKGDPKAAIELYEASLKIALEKRDLNRQVLCLYGLSLAYSDLHHLIKAMQYAQEVLEITHTLDDHFHEAMVLGLIANIYVKTLRYEEAIPYFKKAIELAEAVEDRMGLANHYNNLGQAYSMAGNRARAIEFLERARTLFVELKSDEWIQATTRALNYNRSSRGMIRSAIMKAFYWKVR